ncbi:hypothetical protein BHM03_00046778 [Ensete ventricosum]|nr:hypothetical protein BHM03_00046778 [Ensete ventricosum]
MGVKVMGPRNSCFETWDMVGDFTRAVGRRRRLEPSDASSRTVQHTGGYHRLYDPFCYARCYVRGWVAAMDRGWLAWPAMGAASD